MLASIAVLSWSSKGCIARALDNWPLSTSGGWKVNFATFLLWLQAKGVRTLPIRVKEPRFKLHLQLLILLLLLQLHQATSSIAPNRKKTQQKKLRSSASLRSQSPHRLLRPPQRSSKQSQWTEHLVDAKELRSIPKERAASSGRRQQSRSRRSRSRQDRKGKRRSTSNRHRRSKGEEEPPTKTRGREERRRTPSPLRPRSPSYPPGPGSPPGPPPGHRTQGRGWHGPIPHSNHPRWQHGVNKGVVKRAKQERYHQRRQEQEAQWRPRLRRPAVRVPIRLRRPAIADEQPGDRAPRLMLGHLDMAGLSRLAHIWIKKGKYYHRDIDLVGKVEGSGSKMDRSFWISKPQGRKMRASWEASVENVAPRLTPVLVHGKEYESVDPNSSPGIPTWSRSWQSPVRSLMRWLRWGWMRRRETWRKTWTWGQPHMREVRNGGALWSQVCLDQNSEVMNMQPLMQPSRKQGMLFHKVRRQAASRIFVQKPFNSFRVFLNGSSFLGKEFMDFVKLEPWTFFQDDMV